MKSGQKFFVAAAGYANGPYAFVLQHECVGEACGLIIYKPSSSDQFGAVKECEAFATADEARVECARKLKAARERINAEIDSEIEKIGGNQ